MYSRRPLVRLSTTRIDATRSLSCSTRCDPMNDVPPVTSVFARVRSIRPPRVEQPPLELPSLSELGQEATRAMTLRPHTCGYRVHGVGSAREKRWCWRVAPLSDAFT